MLSNTRTGKTLARRVHLCDTFFSRGRGLMFRKSIPQEDVWLFVLPRAGRTEASIHMFFVFFPIAVVWLDEQRAAVDMALARPFRPYYAPRCAARYFIEGHPSLLEHISEGDVLEWQS